MSWEGGGTLTDRYRGSQAGEQRLLVGYWKSQGSAEALGEPLEALGGSAEVFGEGGADEYVLQTTGRHML